MAIVDIIMPVYNAEKYLKRAIESIISQTFKDWRLVLSVDGSTDNTRKIISGYIFDDPRIFLIDHKTNTGTACALNRAINYLMDKDMSPLLARHDADDYSHPNRLERQVAFLKDHPDIYIVGTGMTIADEKTDEKTVWEMIYPDSISFDKLMDRDHGPLSISHPTVMMRSEVVYDIGVYDEEFNMNCCEDYEFWLRAVAYNFKIANIPNVLYFKTDHPESNIGKLSTRKDIIRAFNGLARAKGAIHRIRFKKGE